MESPLVFTEFRRLVVVELIGQIGVFLYGQVPFLVELKGPVHHGRVLDTVQRFRMDGGHSHHDVFPFDNGAVFLAEPAVIQIAVQHDDLPGIAVGIRGHFLDGGRIICGDNRFLDTVSVRIIFEGRQIVQFTVTVIVFYLQQMAGLVIFILDIGSIRTDMPLLDRAAQTGLFPVRTLPEWRIVPALGSEVRSYGTLSASRIVIRTAGVFISPARVIVRTAGVVVPATGILRSPLPVVRGLLGRRSGTRANQRQGQDAACQLSHI